MSTHLAVCQLKEIHETHSTSAKKWIWQLNQIHILYYRIYKIIELIKPISDKVNSNSEFDCGPSSTAVGQELQKVKFDLPAQQNVLLVSLEMSVVTQPVRLTR